MITFKMIRVGILLTVLAVVWLTILQSKFRSTDWDQPLWVVIYPINGDKRDATQDYIDNLDVEDFRHIDAFMGDEADRYGVTLQQPVETHVAPQISQPPPALPRDGNTLKIMWWSLKLRYWVWRNESFKTAAPDIRIYAVYYDPAVTSTVPHSVGLRNGLMGIANVYASQRMAPTNNVVIAHEMLHTLGASDKYDPLTNYPLHPVGFAEPELDPIVPQQWAEIMGGRIPVSPSRSVIPESLYETLIGNTTAVEIQWVD